MHLYLISLLSIRVVCEDDNKDIQTFSVYNFGDYSFLLNNINDELTIEVPPDTLIFISSLSGYNATILYKEDDEIYILPQKLLPSIQDRLIYYKNAGYLNIISTIDNLQFIFHTLVLSKINKHFDEIIISTNPYEKFQISYDFVQRKSYDYNSSFSENHLLWFISYNYTMCYIRQDIATLNIIDFFIAHPIYYAFPFHSYNESQINFVNCKLYAGQVQWLHSFSKLILIEKVESLTVFATSYARIELQPNYTNVNYYTDYRSVFRRTSFNETRILRRGSNHINLASKIYSKDLSEGIVEFDFSIHNKIELNINHTLLIFPTISSMRIIQNVCTLGIIQKKDQITLESGTYEYVDPNDMNIKIIIYNYLQDSYDTNYIISTSPNEKLLIGTNETDNYTNDQDYVYFMASVANTSTLIEFNGDVTIKKIEINKITKINVETDSTIKGPFVAYIKKNSKSSFVTFLNNEINDSICDANSNYENDGHSFFKKQSIMSLNKNLCISKKHGVYLTHVISLAYTSITFNNEFSYLISASNLVHIWPKEGWSGEILLDNLNDNKIGNENNRTSFYIPKSGGSEIQMMIWKNRIMDETELRIYIRSIPIENYEKESEKQKNCSRVVVFNDIPSKFGINIKPNEKYQEIDIETNDVVCIFPAVSSYYVGSNMNIEVINSNNQKASKYTSIQDYKYCENILYYYNYGSSYYSFIKLDYNTIESKGVVAFRNSEQHHQQHQEEEELIYYDFEIENEYSIHSFGENEYKYIEKGDDIIISPSNTPTPSRSISSTIDYYKNIEIELNETNNHGYVNMYRVRRLTFSCPKSTIFFIHFMEGLEVSFYDYGRHGMNNRINQDSSSKIIHFGLSNGFITVERINSHEASSNEQFVYSFVVLDKINDDEQKQRKCENIYISSDPAETIIIKGPENDSKSYNHILPSNTSLCIWFVFPIYSTLHINNYLPHQHYMIVDNNAGNEIKKSNNEKNGFNFISFLSNVSSTEESNYAKFEVSAYFENDLLKAKDYEIVNGLFTIDSTNGIMVIIPNTGAHERETKGKKKINVMALVVSLVVIVIVVIVVAIVIFLVKRYKNNQMHNNETNQNDQEISLSDQTNTDHENSNGNIDQNIDIHDQPNENENENVSQSPYDISKAQFNSFQSPFFVSAPNPNETNDTPYNADNEMNYRPF